VSIYRTAKGSSSALAEDLVDPASFLASPDAGFISGQTLNVGGESSLPDAGR
jgi:NAD(P)-dependent dehydrogenase (short-subunit alcohol dehydrogenase family)